MSGLRSRLTRAPSLTTAAAALLASALVLASQPADAQAVSPPAPPPSEGTPEPSEKPLRYAVVVGDAPELAPCGGADALRRAVEERLARQVFVDQESADVVLEVEVGTEARGDVAAGGGRARGRLVARIVERDARGEVLGRRDLAVDADECRKRLDTIAVVLAIMIGPPRTTRDQTEKVPAGGNPGDPNALPPPPAETTSAPPAAPPRVWRVAPVAELAGGSGVLPGFAWGLQLGAVVEPPLPRASVIVRALYWPPRSTGTIARADVDRLGGSLLLCADVLRPTDRQGPRAAACAGADAARLHATTANFTRASETGFLLDVLAEMRLGYGLRASRGLVLEPVFAAQVSAALRRDRFTYRDGTAVVRTLLEPAPVAFQASLGLVVHFL